MRPFIIALVLTACASSNGTFDPSVTPRPADEAPEAVLAARAHVVAVYVNATCDALPTYGVQRGTGFWVNSGTVATAGHAMDVRNRMFPDFAIVGPDGCMNGRYADWFEHVDLLFIMVSGRHEGAVDLAPRLTSDGESLWQYVFQDRDDLTKSGIFSPVRIKAKDIVDSDVFFGSRPAPALGDSGAPVFDASGRLVGMTQAIGRYRDKPSFGRIGVHLSSLVIRQLLASCAGGGPCGDD
ncbi:MAG: trypsin-like peptidase domain-containing protein [Patescibacteria group bacterium]